MCRHLFQGRAGHSLFLQDLEGRSPQLAAPDLTDLRQSHASSPIDSHIDKLSKKINC
ncbi:hypothetical protein D3C87_2054900 [compost metagenome]